MLTPRSSKQTSSKGSRFPSVPLQLHADPWDHRAWSSPSRSSVRSKVRRWQAVWRLALWCDIRVMAETAYLGVYCRRWGITLMDGGTVRLPRLVGQGKALEIAMTGRKVTAEECYRIGLCEKVSGHGQARDEAEAIAREIAPVSAGGGSCRSSIDHRNARTAGSRSPQGGVGKRDGRDPQRRHGWCRPFQRRRRTPRRLFPNLTVDYLPGCSSGALPGPSRASKTPPMITSAPPVISMMLRCSPKATAPRTAANGMAA